MSYTPPVHDIAFALRHTAGMDALLESGAFADLDAGDVEAILSEAGKFMGSVLAPLNRVGDATPATLKDGTVTVPPGWGQAYEQWAAGGWCGLSAPEKFGGQALPTALNAAVAEMFNAANMAFGVGPLLTQGAVEALVAHGSEALKAAYLPKLVSGQWAGTMNLTEPQAGTDLAALKTRATRVGDGSYKITGTKIFITYGEHEMTENIIHLVLARLDDAPEGVKGISLFVVPKFLINDDGSLGARNDVKCIGLEHKLGLHASPTCVMAYGEDGGAVGYLVGQEHTGLAAMFTMMNNARLLIGVQGVGIADRAFQQALSFASERRQGRKPGDPVSTSIAIIEHVDVRRMLTTMAALTGAARGICLVAAVAIDAARHGDDDEARAAHQARADLLIPIAKAFSTDIGVEVASLGVQVHGGMGYIEETGAAQHYRDARIAPIYEGTNGIQAIDLVTRKLARDNGRAAQAFIDEARGVAEEIMTSNSPRFGKMGYRLVEAIDALDEATDWLLQTGSSEPRAALAGATPYLRLFGLVAGGAYLARGALVAERDGDSGPPQMRNQQIALARYFAENHLPEATGQARVVTDGAQALLDYELIS